MTAYLYISASGGPSRRVDLTNIASLFSEVEDAPGPAPTARFGLRAVAAALLMLLAFGDTVLVNPPDVLTASTNQSSLAGRANDL